MQGDKSDVGVVLALGAKSSIMLPLDEGGVVSLAFLYNVASCIAYAFVSAAYGSLHYVERRRGYFFVALTFLAYTIDINTVFMYEFVPEFAMQFEGARNAYPMFRVAFNMVVILLYRLVLGSLLSRSFSLVEGFFLGSLHDGGFGKWRFVSRIGCAMARVSLYQVVGDLGNRVRHLLLGGRVSAHEPMAMGSLALTCAHICLGGSGNVFGLWTGGRRALCLSS